MAFTPLEKLRVYRMAEQLSDSIWELVGGWSTLAKNTVGTQIVRAADSVGANIAEGYGRGTYADNKRFVRIARGSLYETRHFLRRAFKRGLVPEGKVEELQKVIGQLPASLNAYLKSIGNQRETET